MKITILFALICISTHTLLFQKPTDLGDIMFSLSYLPTAERLTIVIVKARNLRWSYSKRAGGGNTIKCY